MLEMVFAMGLLFLVGAFVMNMFVQGSRQMAKATNREKLSSLARAKASEMRLLAFADLDTISTSSSFPAPNNDYNYTISYSDFVPYPQTEARIVTVAVSHNEHGRIVTRLVRSRVPPLDPGQVAFNKFGCSACHSLPAAGYPAGPDLVPLDSIGSLGVPRPFGPSPTTAQLESYIVDTIADPNFFDPFPAGIGSPYETLTMTDFKYEGEGDPTYDPSVDVSLQEGIDIATWIAGLQ